MNLNPWTPVVKYLLTTEEYARMCGTLPIVERWTAGWKLIAMTLERAHRSSHK